MVWIHLRGAGAVLVSNLGGVRFGPLVPATWGGAVIPAPRHTQLQRLLLWRSRRIAEERRKLGSLRVDRMTCDNTLVAIVRERLQFL